MNSKLPVTILQELSVAQRWAPPEYTLLDEKKGTSNTNEFHYQVNANGQQAVGVGRSKKEAKHNAASALLDKLPKRARDDPVQSDVAPKKVKIHNYTSDLLNTCLKKKLPPPTFTQVAETGPAHCKEFICECKVTSITTSGTGHSKKEAQHFSAKEMMDRITNTLSESSTAALSKPEPDSSAKSPDGVKDEVDTKLEASSPVIENETEAKVKVKAPDSSLSTAAEEAPQSENAVSAIEKVCSDLCKDLDKGES
ncbi:hypothetical protein PPYR_03911 [Photinus pyralis]|uniref:DRBM domain-containing protein n=2 Tax=Photinus pyralis TaxID=7054 RepID=A0A5N4AWI5_PHOPY|nr:interferon-inducible double-stranded RNA-dependent protein kinase activator A homolog [Photinus pyralis]KAB0801725.1 hypothetical protein PPYR_03911 [Photinus pyralis]